MLGCKSVLSVFSAFSAAELIDTCWDVNIDYNLIFGLLFGELIDTCWDVNAEARRFWN